MVRRAASQQPGVSQPGIDSSRLTGIQSVEEFRRLFEKMAANIKRVIKGKDEVIHLAVTALVADGNILFEDVPGTGKTMMARALAQTIDASVSRIQCTPDLLPADVTGSPVLDRKTNDFQFRPGPIFANVVLADEINRATPKTQSALLEAMQERTVTVDGVTHPLPKPFFVIATENPIELAGTFPLPEAQLDRFLFKLTLGYADADAEAEVLRANELGEPIGQLTPVVDAEALLEMMAWAARVEVAEPLRKYIIDVVQQTRHEKSLELGASTRASLAIQRSAKVLAAAHGRDDVGPDDIKKLIEPVLAHRLLLTPDAQLRGETVNQVIERVVAKARLPVMASRSRS